MFTSYDPLPNEILILLHSDWVDILESMPGPERRYDSVYDKREKSFYVDSKLSISPQQERLLTPLFIDGKTTDPLMQLRNVMNGTLRIINHCKQNDVDTLFFLDKSARPLATITKRTWERLLPEKEKPQIRFIDVGRDPKQVMEGLYRPEPFTINPHVARQLADRYQGIKNDGKILVVDEFSNTKKSVKQAEVVLAQMFPDADVHHMVAFEKLQPWFESPNVLPVIDPPNATEIEKLTRIARKKHTRQDYRSAYYMANPNPRGKGERVDLRRQIDAIVDIIEENASQSYVKTRPSW